MSMRVSVCCIDFNPLHKRKIDHECIVKYGCAGTTVPTTPDCQENGVFTGKFHRGHHVRLVSAKCHQCRAAIDPSVPDFSRRVVVGVPWRDKPPMQAFTK